MTANLSGVNNSNRRIDSVRWGPVNGIDTGTRGTYFLDDFESRRYNFIGGILQGGGHVLARLLVPTLTASRDKASTATPWATATAQPARHAQGMSKPGHLSIVSPRPAFSPLASNGDLVVTVISYTYDALYRLTGRSTSPSRAGPWTAPISTTPMTRWAIACRRASAVGRLWTTPMTSPTG